MRYFWTTISLLSFLAIFGLLVWTKIHPYSNSPSALIGIWDGFAAINPGIVDPGFVIFKEGGYDGQFFYFIAKSLFSDLKWELIVDSYFFRLHRIGFTLLIGIPSAIFGFQYYPIFGLLFPLVIFLFSVHCLHQMLPEGKKWYVLFYLFSPYSLNSHLLLVADGLFTSIAILLVYSFWKNSNHAITILLLLFTIFTRELGIVLALPFLILYLREKNYKLTFVYLTPALLFFGFLLWTRWDSPSHLGTNPLGFRDMVDYPLFGFIKSFFDNGIYHLSAKESVKILLLIQWISLSFYFIQYLGRHNLQLILDKDLVRYNLVLLLPILASLGVIFIAEEGYWRSFDNLSRMFTFILPFALLLNARKDSPFLSFFRYSSFALFLFLIVRIMLITKTKGFFISP